MDKETLVKDHLALANLYSNGKGVWWKTIEEASHVLSLTEPRVSAQQIKQARAVAAFPAEVIRLFEKSGTNTYVRRKIIEAKECLGWPEVVKRALTLKPAETRAERLTILSTLAGGKRSEKVFRGETPLALQKTYQKGLENGRWKNLSQASKELGFTSNSLYKAMDICKLRKPVTDHFPLDKISVYLGTELLKVMDLLGCAEFERRVSLLEENNQNLSFKAKLAKIRADTVSVVTEIKVRRARGKVIIELHCDDKNGKLTSRQRELVSLIGSTINAFNCVQ
ncbi:hypothetical protein [Burkholderia sp. PAMC 26561]|uniref:hypothetical protein n=1 Tax=Burkholderia sp. PAMC 26561 TaxID=1795043 RepID=UPI00076B3015|nr:hypothetical protein [Burkholderia sp. PAMC 26561]AME28699.1 hypothetical protein AXG89_33485 [Burkholderia sp. PAMC 26561]